MIPSWLKKTIGTENESVVDRGWEGAWSQRGKKKIGDEGNALYLHCGGGYMTVCIPVSKIHRTVYAKG